MRLRDARAHIGDKVVYRPPGLDQHEEGVVTSVNDRYVFVRYGADVESKVTRPEDLTAPGCSCAQFDHSAPADETGGAP